jgi:hypothetical protein
MGPELVLYSFSRPSQGSIVIDQKLNSLLEIMVRYMRVRSGKFVKFIIAAQLKAK